MLVEFIEDNTGELAREATTWDDFPQMYEAAKEWADQIAPFLDRIRELEAQLVEAKRERDNCAKLALDVLSSCFCDAHNEQVKQMSFPVFTDWVQEMGCHACASERAEKAEAQLADANTAKEIAECAAYQYSTRIAQLELDAKTRAEKAEADAARLRQDKQRLDFLSCHMAQINLEYRRPKGEAFLYSGKKTLRELIDIEMNQRAALCPQ